MNDTLQIFAFHTLHIASSASWKCRFFRKLAGPHGGSIAKAEKAANKCGFTLMDTNLGEVFRVPGAHCNLCIFLCSTLFKSNMALWMKFAPEEGFNPSRKVQSVLQALSPLRFQCSFLFGSDWEIERQLQCRWWMIWMAIVWILCAFHSISPPFHFRNPGAWGDARTCLLQPFWGGKGKERGRWVKDGRLEILGQSWKASWQFDVEMMWKYFRFFNSSRFLAFEPFEFWIVSVSEVLFDSDSLPLPCAMLFNAGDCYARCLQQIWQGRHDSTAPVLKCGNDQTIIQSSQWKRRVSAERERERDFQGNGELGLQSFMLDVTCVSRGQKWYCGKTRARQDHCGVLSRGDPSESTFPYSIDSFTEKASQKCLICRVFRQQSPECLGIR